MEDCIANNIKSIKEKADKIKANVELVAVTKTVSAERINEAIAAGVTIIGENKVQELLEKWDKINHNKVQVHLIGHLQTNKVKQIIDKVDTIQSLDSIHLAEEINKQEEKVGKVMNVLLQVNIGNEESKSGVKIEEAEEILRSISHFRNIKVQGLMAIPPICEEKEESLHYFSQMYKLFLDIQSKNIDNINMRTLSMGMSGDYETAVMAGSNMIRVGSGIFGKRNY